MPVTPPDNPGNFDIPPEEFAEKFHCNIDSQHASGESAGNPIWEGLTKAGAAVASFSEAVAIAGRKGETLAYIQDGLDSLTGSQNGGPSHLDQFYEKKYTDLTNAYLNAEDKEAFENGLKFIDAANQVNDYVSKTLPIALTSVIGIGIGTLLMPGPGSAAGGAAGGALGLSLEQALQAATAAGVSTGMVVVTAGGVSIAVPIATTPSYYDMIKRFQKAQNEADSETGNWNKVSFDSPEDSLDYHYGKHGDEVGATSRDQYLRKAEEFAKTAKKGSTKSRVDGAVEGTIRYKKNGKYIDIAPDGSIVSFGKQ